jgi:hypothetical protein
MSPSQTNLAERHDYMWWNHCVRKAFVNIRAALVAMLKAFASWKRAGIEVSGVGWTS